MRAPAVCVLASTLGLACALAFAQGDDKKTDDPKAPVNPFAEAKEGDWETLVMTHTQGSAPARKFAVTYRAGKIADESITIATETLMGNGKKNPPAEKTFKKTEAPALKSVVGNPRDKITEVKVADEKKTVGGKEFACKKVSYTATLESDKGAITRKIVLWLSTDAKPYGLVASSTEQSIGGGPTVKIEGELAGLGNGDKASWGKKAEELDLK